ncbi:cyclic nucleotide-gated cation channel subunit a [Holotrichia oblita]|uniref:Cyclic nucleotide-gated cation channel subunit a n=1 Tax=Holotrichia oblita TaxID=644536 RepID=A0ACB9SYA2_HOLOL|nr:cyclic nucleotide-gated cation channel subunit a [Holotrichia oblita]
MVYIVSGVVQILSEDDNETPIISFSEGTCLGETAMLIDYPSTSSVICKVFCEATVLERKHYIKFSKLYPDQSRIALRTTLKRYDRARKYRRLTTLQKKQMAYESDELNLQWYFNYGIFSTLGIMYLFNVITLANITAYHAVTNHDIQGVNEYMRRFQVAIQAFGLNNLYTRIANNITKMYQFDGLACIYSDEIYQYLPQDLFKIVRNATLSEYLATFPFFSIYDKKSLKDIASKITTSIYEKHELIVLQGEHCSHMHIVIQGYCISYLEDEPKVLGPGSNLSMLEVCMHLPALRTIYTITHCLLMSLSMEDFNQILLAYPNFYSIVTEAVNITREESKFLQSEQWPNSLFSTFMLKSEKPRHVNVFRNVLQKEYYEGFPSWLRPLHLLVIPVTLTQYGNVIKFWEISRAIFAMLNVILLPMSMMMDKTDFWHTIFVFLDLMAWIDICLRFYVAYFDERGLEVTHPRKTATHYLLNGFLLDLIAVFPTEMFIETGIEADPWTRLHDIFYAVGAVCRPPGTSDFFDAFESCLAELTLSEAKIFCLDDFNVDSIDVDNKITIDFVSLIDGFGLEQIVDAPTRITFKNNTMIDLILTNNADAVVSIVTVNASEVSDHELVLCTLNVGSPEMPDVLRTSRDFRNFDYNYFCALLYSVLWRNIFDMTNINEKLDFFNETITNLFDTVASFRTFKITKPMSPLGDRQSQVVNTTA